MNIQESLGKHKAKLAAALEIHAFNRDVDDINDRINEKVTHGDAPAGHVTNKRLPRLPRMHRARLT